MVALLVFVIASLEIDIQPARYTTKEKIFYLLICCTSTVLVSVFRSLVASHV